mgnify:CR=1 FL=1
MFGGMAAACNHFPDLSTHFERVAIDRQQIIDGAMFGLGTPIGTHFAPHNPAYVDLLDRSNYDPELSRQLLEEAGMADGFTTTLLPAASAGAIFLSAMSSG